MFVLAGHSKVRFAGNDSVGGVESRTVIVWIAFVTLPQRSRAVHVRWMTFVAAQLVTTESLNVTVAVLQPSMAVAIPVLVVLVFAGHSKVTFGGITSAGARESRTVMVWILLVLFPQESTAVQVRATTFVPPQLVVTTSL